MQEVAKILSTKTHETARKKPHELRAFRVSSSCGFVCLRGSSHPRLISQLTSDSRQVANVLRLLLLQLDLEKFRPQLARHEESVALLVVCDAVENGLLVLGLSGLEEARHVNPAVDASGLRVNADDAFVVPDVRENLALNIFEFVYLFERASAVEDAYGAPDLVRVRVNEANLVRAVAQD